MRLGDTAPSSYRPAVGFNLVDFAAPSVDALRLGFHAAVCSDTSRRGLWQVAPSGGGSR